MDMVFITDAGCHCVQSFRSDGTMIAQWGSYGFDDGEFFGPWGLAVLARSQDRILARSKDRGHPTRDEVYVVDSWNNRIQVFSLEGVFLRKWGSSGNGDGQFDHPCGVTVLARSQDRGHPTQDLIFVSEYHGHRIQAFRSDGIFLFKWGLRGSADGQFSHPEHLSLDSNRDLLFVADTQNHRVQVFELDGSFMCKWGSKGRADGEFVFPSSVAVHPTNHVVYVSDEHSVQAFSLFRTTRKRKRELKI